MKNKKVLIIVFITAVVLLGTTAYANVSNASGYDACKNAVINALTVGNYSAKYDLRVTDNGYFVSDESTVYKTNGTGDYSQADRREYPGYSYEGTGDSTVVSGSESYLKGNTMVNGYTDTSGVTTYYSYDYPTTNSTPDTVTPSQLRLYGAIADIIVGDCKNYVVTNGGHFSVNIEGGQIPQIAQLALAVVAEDNKRRIGDTNYDMVCLNNGDVNMFVSNFVLKSVTADGTIDANGNIKDATAVVIVSGTDNNGYDHLLTLTLSAELTDIGCTVPDFLDPVENNISLLNPNVGQFIFDYMMKDKIMPSDNLIRSYESYLKNYPDSQLYIN